jgi:hypothetical protein
METIGERLRWAINRMPPEGRRRGVALLIHKLDGVRGATYPSINAYLSNETDPPLEFLDAAAPALGVDKAWLAFGPPHQPTGAHAKAATATEAVSVPDFRDTLAPGLVRAVLMGVGFPAVGEVTHIPAWAAPLAELWAELPEEHYTNIVGALAGPLRAYGIDVEALDGPWQLRDYILAMTPVLFQLAAEAQRQARQRQDLHAEPED